MNFTETDFLEHIDIVNSNNYYFGNEILYRSFGFNILPKPNSTSNDIGKLSSAIWLVGKSYSADPTRSAGDLVKNNGIGLSFNTIADAITKHNDYSKFYCKIAELANAAYSFNNSSTNDENILFKSAECVSLLNDMVKAAMGDDSKNVISFCSKLLHFICPNVFFIIDSYSLDGGIGLFSGTADRKFKIETISPVNWIDIDNSARSKFKHMSKTFNRSFENTHIQTYFKHCCNSYSLAAFLNNNHKCCIEQIAGDPNSKYMTRLVDSILIRIGK